MIKLKRQPYLNHTQTKLRLTLLVLVLIILGAFTVMQYESLRRVTYIIPPGVDAGRTRLVIPSEIVLTVGVKDTLIIENQDNVVHTFGPFVIGPGATFSKRFNRPVVYEGVCTFHQDKQMRVVVNSAPWPITVWNRIISNE